MDYKEMYKALLDKYGTNEISGLISTSLDNVHLFWIKDRVERAPLICTPGIVLIGQGVKIGHLDDKTFQYDQDNYLISSVTTAYECETRATEENPLIGLMIDLDITQVRHIIEKIEKHASPYIYKVTDVFIGVEPVEINNDMHDIIKKLLKVLLSPLESAVLGESIINEILYRVLLGKHGNALVALSQQESRYSQIAAAISYIHLNYMNQISIDELAFQTSMSSSSFHRAFKTVTGESPLQYLKKVRLNKARFMLAQEGYKVNQAAEKVGYESVSQFSREFKRHFQISPKDAIDVVAI